MAATALPLPPEAGTHAIAARACLRCGAQADGRLRVAIWEEEEKGRLGARPAVLCAACHAGFFAGAFGRVEVARWYHAAKDYVPREWIGRIDRDRLLETVCLNCGVILELPPAGDAVDCPRCGATNRLDARNGSRITASLASPPSSSPPSSPPQPQP
jgi:DNA-directed RNA polymerase subunit RPC12/RpoP